MGSIHEISGITSFLMPVLILCFLMNGVVMDKLISFHKPNTPYVYYVLFALFGGVFLLAYTRIAIMDG
jgi:hypothetical protein